VTVVNAFGVEHTVFSKAAMTPEERAAKKAEQIRQMELRGIKPKEAAPANPPKPRRTSPSPAARERVTRPVAGPPTGIKRATWEITRSQTKNWAIGAGVAAGAAYGAKKIADRNRRVSKSERTRDAGATALGGGAGLAATKTARNVGGWIGRETVKDQRHANFGREHQKTMREHNHKYGAVTHNPDVDFAGNKKARYNYFRNYPKNVPGGKGQRLLALEGHPAVKRPVLVAGTVAGAAAAHHYAQKQKVRKADSGPTRSHEKKRVPDYVSPLLPASTVRAYDNSRAHKREAGVKNFAAKGGLGAIGGTAGLLASAVAVRKIPALRNGVKFGSKKAVSRDTLRGWTQSTGAGAGAAAGGGIGGAYSLKRIQENPKYRYERG
jgi:hypothetical protein